MMMELEKVGECCCGRAYTLLVDLAMTSKELYGVWS